MTNAHTILCIGASFGRNYGDRAIYHVIRSAIRAQPGHHARRFPIKPPIVNKMATGMGPVRKLSLGLLLLPRHYGRMYRRVRRASAVIIGGGNLIHDVYPLNVVQFLFTCLTIRAARRKFLIFCVGAGPLSTAFSRLCISLACRMAEGIVVRDSYSKSVLEQCWGLRHLIRSKIVPDVVLTIAEPKPRPDPARPSKIGISTMFYMAPGRYPGGSAESYNAYLDRMERLVRLIASRFSAEIILFSNEPREDQQTVHDLARRLSDISSVHSVRITSLLHVVALTRSLDLHIGARLHSLILCLAQGVPSVALTSHGRVTGLFTDLGATDLVHDIGSFSPELVVDTLERLRGERSRQLLDRVELLAREAKQGLASLTDELNTLVAEGRV